MKKILLMTTALLLLLSGCETIEEWLKKLQEEPACQLISMELDIPADPARSLTEFFYNADGQLTEVKDSEYDLKPLPYVTRYELTYAGNNLSVIQIHTKFYEEPEKTDHTWSFFYSGDLIDSIFVQNGETYGNSSGYYLTEYSGDLISKLTYYHIDAASGAATQHDTRLLTWTGDNLTEVIWNYPNADPMVYSYTYDDKKTPLNSIGLALSPYGDLSLLSKNNVVSRSTSYSGTVTNTTNYELEYNEQGYPVSVRDMQTWDTYPTVYEYDCN